MTNCGQLLIFQTGNKKKCREVWPTVPIEYEKVFAIFLDILLLVLPLIVLGAAYFLISQTLWQSMDTEKQLVKQTSGTVYLSFSKGFMSHHRLPSFFPQNKSQINTIHLRCSQRKQLIKVLSPKKDETK
jgi:hypothetical protein